MSYFTSVLSNVSIFCFLSSYFIALLLESARLFRRSTINRVVMWLFGLAGLLAHSAYLLVRSSKTDLPPLLSSSQDWLLVLAWLAVLVYLFLTTFDRDLAIGVFVLPVVLLLIMAAYFVSDMPNSAVEGNAGSTTEVLRAWGMLHATLLMLGVTVVIVGFVLSMMYLVQHRRLKSKRIAKAGLQLPSLARLARWNWWAVIVSVPMLTLGMGIGVVLGILSQKDAHPLSFADPVIIGYIVAWLVMAAFFLWLVIMPRPASKQVAWLTLWAFGFLLITVIGLQIVSGKHVMQWRSWHSGLETAPAVRPTFNHHAGIRHQVRFSEDHHGANVPSVLESASSEGGTA